VTVRVEHGPDAGAVWHYGDPFREQRELVAGRAGVDLSHRPVFTITGRDRLTWLNDITTQAMRDLAPGVPTVAYILSAQGHLQHVFGATDDGETLWCHTEAGHAEPLLDWLRKMVFAARVEIAEAADHVVAIPPAAAPVVVPRTELDATLGAARAGSWASEALRIASGTPRIFLDTDERTIPNELANPEDGVLGPAVALGKGCYPGQEAVARTYNLGRPPRRLTLLHLDGTANDLPPVGADVLADGRPVGRMGTSERHYELGPIGLALLKRNVPPDAALEVAGIAAAQEVLVDPEAGLHFRPARG
jgi:folate-binding protein YgfZ